MAEARGWRVSGRGVWDTGWPLTSMADRPLMSEAVRPAGRPPCGASSGAAAACSPPSTLVSSLSTSKRSHSLKYSYACLRCRGLSSAGAGAGAAGGFFFCGGLAVGGAPDEPRTGGSDASPSAAVLAATLRSALSRSWRLERSPSRSERDILAKSGFWLGRPLLLDPGVPPTGNSLARQARKMDASPRTSPALSPLTPPPHHLQAPRPPTELPPLRNPLAGLPHRDVVAAEGKTQLMQIRRAAGLKVRTSLVRERGSFRRASLGTTRATRTRPPLAPAGSSAPRHPAQSPASVGSPATGRGRLRRSLRARRRRPRRPSS